MVIFGLCAILVVVMLGLSYLAFFDLGPKSDKDIISSIPSKFEVTQVLAKDSDIIDGSCTAIILEISERASEKILEDGLSFFDHQTEIELDNISRYLYEEWKPLSILKTEPQSINNESFLSAVKCSNINNAYKTLAKELLDFNVGFYKTNPKRRTIYVIFPQQRKFFITHLD